MYECPNCGGNLRFDIPLQQLHCDFCGTDQDPYSYEKEKDAIESEVFDVTIYTCPQCGGEIMTTNVSATGFCSYCGASTVLDSRIRGEKKPKWIIPFQKTKEDCKKSFASMMRRSIYAPKELKSPEYLENFRGIYMPYWMYDVQATGIRGMHASTSSRKGDYIVTRHFSLSCDLDAPYTGVSFDASSSLDDSLSESIAPFDPGAAKDFVPSYLCGFYADTADVPASVYRDDAIKLVAEDTAERARKEVFPGQGAEIPASPRDIVQYSIQEPSYGMFPVWFLTYRHKDRVAYAVMNGQTGNISSDLPIVEWKYLAGSLILAVPLFFLLNMVLTVTAPTALLLTAIPAILAGHACLSEIRTQLDTESHASDKGYHAAVQTARKTESFVDTIDFSSAGGAAAPAEAGDAAAANPAPEAAATGAVANPAATGAAANTAADASAAAADSADSGGAAPRAASAAPDYAAADTAARRKSPGRKKGKSSSPMEFLKKNWILIAFFVAYGFYMFSDSVDFFSAGFVNLLLTGAAVIAAIILTLSGARLQRDHREEDPKVFPGLAGVIAALAVTVLVSIVHPVSDLYFYAASIVSILCSGFTLASVIRRYNRMATRPLPDFFNRQGGNA